MPTDNSPLQRVGMADLAPGEHRARRFDPATLDVRLISSPYDPLFGEAYAHLWGEFGDKNEMESRDVIERRMTRGPSSLMATKSGPVNLLYQMILARAPNGAFAAVRDHTAILPRDNALPAVILHLSHLLIAPAYRGSGIAGWMRTWPIATAAACASAALGTGTAVPTILVAEMEHPDAGDAEKTARLTAYERAGFKKVDPAAVDYLQPDFRDPATIDADGVRPLPMSLVVRQVGRESETAISGADVRRIVAALYGMYGIDFRAQDMAVVYDRMRALPPPDATVALVPPTTMASR